jgi:hypothetical protein
MNIKLDYDEKTGAISYLDKSGVWFSLTHHMGLEHLEHSEVVVEEGTSIVKLVKLKDAGFSVEDILALNARGLA